jgi:hypothetical protein
MDVEHVVGTRRPIYSQGIKQIKYHNETSSKQSGSAASCSSTLKTEAVCYSETLGHVVLYPWKCKIKLNSVALVRELTYWPSDRR